MYSHPDKLNELNPNGFLGIEKQPWSKQFVSKKTRLNAPKEEKGNI